jgi:hypothetical protein
LPYALPPVTFLWAAKDLTLDSVYIALSFMKQLFYGMSGAFHRCTAGMPR